MKRSDEAGLSIVEVLIATFILFFVITALAGLLTMAFAMTTTARKQTLGTAFMQETMEQVRTLPWESIGTVGGDPEGVLPSFETTTSGDTTFTVSRTITWVNDPSDDPTAGVDADPHDYKSVTITLNWTNPNGSYSTLSAQTSIRKPWANTNAPTVDFTSANVAANSIVYGSTNPLENYGRVHSTILEPDPPLYVQATADDNLDADGKIASLIFYVDGRVLRNPNASPNTASWAPAEQSCTSDLYPWDTMAVDESGTPLYPDGIRELKVEVWDNSGARDFKIINVTVDNYAPPMPTNFVSSVATPNANCFDTVWLSWTGGKDGTDWPQAYELERIMNGTTETVISVPGTLSRYTDSPRTPFTFYAYRIRATSPRGLASAWSAQTPYVMTRPNLTAAVRKSGNDRIADLSWSAPTFSGVTQLHYHIYRKSSWTSGTNLQDADELAVTKGKHSSPGWYTATTYTSAAYNRNDVWYWQIRASFFIGATHYSVYSNVIGPSGPDITSYPIP